MFVFGQNGCIRKSGCIRARWLFSGNNGFFRGKNVVCVLKWLYSSKVVVFGLKWLYSAKVVVFGQIWL